MWTKSLAALLVLTLGGAVPAPSAAPGKRVAIPAGSRDPLCHPSRRAAV